MKRILRLKRKLAGEDDEDDFLLAAQAKARATERERARRAAEKKAERARQPVNVS